MNISQCLNPDCLHKNPPEKENCEQCGSKLMLGDRYRPVGCLGKGGMGRTFFALDEHRLGTPCVIKQFLPVSRGKDELQKLIELFRQEAICLRDLGKHPQIPDLEAFFEQEGKFYLIQELIDGQDLLKEIKQKGKLNETEIRQILNSLLPVLHFIHSKNVIHRDIKPSNIIRRKDGTLVLIDFGVSKQLSEGVVTSIGTVTGTIGYAAPEQMRGIVYPCSDLYALGSTCIRLLTGCFPEPNGMDVLYDPLEGQWRWRDKANVSPNLAAVLDKILQEKVKERFQTAAEVWQALNSKPSTPKPASNYSNSYTQSNNSSVNPGNNQRTNRYSTSSYYTSPNDTSSGRVNSPNNQRTNNYSSSSYRSRVSRTASKYGIRSKTNIPLESEVGVDYNKLKYVLDQHNFKQADQETYKLMLSIANRESEGWLRAEDIENFPCADLQTIDRLWVEYSKRRFGFSIQKRIYESIAGTMFNQKKIWFAFGDQVGWRVGGKWLSYQDVDFSLKAPSGHLPCGAPPNDLIEGMVQSELSCNFGVGTLISSIACRLAVCNNNG